MANVSSSNGLEKRPKLRFPGFDEPWEHKELLHYLVENTDRNKQLKFGKENVLSVSGEYGIVNQIAFQGRSFAGESVADYHVVETDDIVYTKSPLKAKPYGIIKVNNGVPGMKRPLAYVTAAWRGDECEITEQAAKYCRIVYDAGYSPICPMLFLPLFLNDAVPEEHKNGIDMGRDLLRRSRVLVVCGNYVNEAVKNDIAVAQRLGITATTLEGILTVKGQGRR